MQAADFSPIRFSTDDPSGIASSAWRDFFGPRVFGLEIEPVPDMSFHCDVTVRLLPGISMVTAVNSPARFLRTPALLADGRDHFGLHVNSFSGTISQRGREVAFGPGDAVLVNAGEAGTTVSPGTSRFRCLHIRRAALAPLVPGLDDAVLRRIAPETEPLQYMLRYVRFLEEETLADAELARTAAIHLGDLFALVLGATHDATMVAQGRGLRAARLQAIKQYVVENLCQRGLSVVAVAARHRLTPRYVQRLFETEGTTFSEFLLDQRLTRVYRMLADPRFAGRPVSALALDAGFGDVSYFNRCFRRRFGASPTHFRGVEGNR